MTSRRTLAASMRRGLAVIAVSAIGSCGGGSVAATPRISCASAHAFHTIDAALPDVAARSYQLQVAAHDSWVDALKAIEDQLPVGDDREAVRELEQADTVASNVTWPQATTAAYDRVAALVDHCR